MKKLDERGALRSIPISDVIARTTRRTAAMVLLFSFSALALGADEWKTLGPSDFPARVAAIGFGGRAIKDGESVSWGRWSVGLDEGTTAHYATGAFTRITISPLVCSNEIAGKQKCAMVFDRDSRTWDCTIIGDSMPQISIVFPTDLRLR